MIGGVPVHGEKGGRGVGVHGVRLIPKLAAQIHAQKRGGLFRVLGKNQTAKRGVFRFQRGAEKIKLRGFSRTVRTFQNNQLSRHGLFPRIFISGV
jgi:hypothetical protein